MKKVKQSLALLLAVIMVLSLNISTFATTTSGITTTTIPTPSTIVSATIGGSNAVFQQDSNGSAIYIRAMLPSGKTEMDLKNARIVITTTQGTSLSSSELTFSKNRTIYTCNSADLLNKPYTITIGGAPYILAAGLQDGSVPVSSNDSLGIKAATLDGNTAEIYGTNVQNPFTGNPAAATNNKWTFVEYFVKSDVSKTTDVDGTLTLPAGASVKAGGCAVQKSGDNYRFNLDTSSPSFTVENGTETRTYHVQATVVQTGVTVTYNFDWQYLNTYTGANAAELRTKAQQIQAAADAYFGANHQVTVPSGTTAMKVMQDFIAAANLPNPTNINGGTYVASINGLGEFSAGSMSGWMYRAGAAGKYPNVGAADYRITTAADGPIIWTYVVDYSVIPW
ncbi:DUF4430 domain-containing protein [Oscillospiraceae bacterium PP1C4]